MSEYNQNIPQHLWLESSFNPDEQCLAFRISKRLHGWDFSRTVFNCPLSFPNNLSCMKSPSKGADRGRKTADPALRGIPHLLRPNNPSDRTSASWGFRHLFWLQRSRAGGEGRVCCFYAFGKTQCDELVLLLPLVFFGCGVSQCCPGSSALPFSGSPVLLAQKSMACPTLPTDCKHIYLVSKFLNWT